MSIIGSIAICVYVVGWLLSFWTMIYKVGGNLSIPSIKIYAPAFLWPFIIVLIGIKEIWKFFRDLAKEAYSMFMNYIRTFNV